MNHTTLACSAVPLSNGNELSIPHQFATEQRLENKVPILLSARLGLHEVHCTASKGYDNLPLDKFIGFLKRCSLFNHQRKILSEVKAT